MPRTGYTVIAIRGGTDEPRQMERFFPKVPPDGVLAKWTRDRKGKFDLVVRYYPSKKGWRILDMRTAQILIPFKGDRTPYWGTIKRSKKVYASEAAAIMTAIYMLNPSTQLELEYEPKRSK
jgi:hypothetical protein